MSVASYRNFFKCIKMSRPFNQRETKKGKRGTFKFMPLLVNYKSKMQMFGGMFGEMFGEMFGNFYSMFENIKTPYSL